MLDRIREGTVRVANEQVYPLDRIRDTLAASEAGWTRGKIVVQVV